MRHILIAVGITALLAAATSVYAAEAVVVTPSAGYTVTAPAQTAVVPVGGYGYRYGYYPRYYTYRPYGYDPYYTPYYTAPNYYYTPGPAYGPAYRNYGYYPYRYRYWGPRVYLGY